jgi:hypothetical protein
VQEHGVFARFAVAQSTVARYLPRSRKPPSQTWRTFLTNHLAQTAAIDFFRDTNSLHWMHSTTGRGRACQSLESDVLANKKSASTRSTISVPQGCGLIRTEFSVGTVSLSCSEVF